MMPLVDAAGDRRAGGKARTLARALAAGLPVPDGFVVLPAEPVDEDELSERLARLGGERFAVRSSADVEDRPGASAAGVFASVVGVAATEVARAIERVRASAATDTARAYLEARGLGPASMAVLVQPLVEARRLGVLHTAPVEEGALAAEERDPREPEWGEVAPARVPLGTPLADGALRLSALVGADADVEYALTGAGPVFLQARPLSSPPPARNPRDWAAGPGDWVRDADHNPDPLSRAQEGLVALVNGLTGPRLTPQLVLHGYLYVAASPPRPAVDVEIALERVFADEIEPACDRALAPLEAREPSPSSLEEALAAYALVVQRSMGELAPSLRRARRTLEQLLRSNIDDPTAWGALLAGAGGRTLARDQALWELGRAPPSERPSLLAGYLARFGAYAPVWDVAAPPDDEAPDRVLAAAELIARGPSPASRHEQAAREARAAERAAIHRVRNQESHGTAAAQGFQAILEAARRALAIGEDDDALFFRAQRVVRRPLRALGEALAAASVLDGPDAVFDLPIDEARRLARDPARLARTLDPSLARRGRAAREAAQRLAPPVAIRGGAPTWRGGAGALVGAGTAGRARGRAFVLDDPARAPATLPPETVLVARAILPSLTYLIPAAAALVTDHGGALSHGATLAREYGVPAVLGTGSATRVLRDGDALLVDADGGRVLRLGKP